MATQAYYDWRAKGSPYTVATPIEELVDWASLNRIALLGVLGNLAHLTNNNPQDHTPFSYTAWPWPLPGYIVTACDLGEGDWAEKFIDETRRGLHPWVKYINHRNKQHNFKNGYTVSYSSDAHCHVSARTDKLNAHINMDPQSQVEPERKSVKFIYAPNRAWAVVGDTFREITSQTVANSFAIVFGNALVVDVRDYDAIKASFIPTEGK